MSIVTKYIKVPSDLAKSESEAVVFAEKYWNKKTVYKNGIIFRPVDPLRFKVGWVDEDFVKDFDGYKNHTAPFKVYK